MFLDKQKINKVPFPFHPIGKLESMIFKVGSHETLTIHNVF